MNAGLFHQTTLDEQPAVPHSRTTEASTSSPDRHQSAWEKRGGNPPFRMQVIRRRRCDKRRRRYQHSEKVEVLTWLEEFRVPRRPFDSRFLREEDDIDDPNFRRPTVIEAAKYFDIPRESIMNWRKQRARLLPSTPIALTPPDTPSLTVSSLLNEECTKSTSGSIGEDERERRFLSITSLIEPQSPASWGSASVLPSPEPTPPPYIQSHDPRCHVPRGAVDAAWATHYQ